MTMRATSVMAAVGITAGLVAIGTLPGCSPRPSLPAAAAENQVAELQVPDIVQGEGATAVTGSRVTVHYTGWLHEPGAADSKGREFDSSRKGGSPFSFTLGAGQVIAGWDRGVSGMRVGGQRRLVIPSALAYGDTGAGGVIPPKATLVFDVELLDVQGPR
jgi:FKBP-type peptidyl-prolyl cis-trans isomerase FkpA